MNWHESVRRMNDEQRRQAEASKAAGMLDDDPSFFAPRWDGRHALDIAPVWDACCLAVGIRRRHQFSYRGWAVAYADAASPIACERMKQAIRLHDTFRYDRKHVGDSVMLEDFAAWAVGRRLLSADECTELIGSLLAAPTAPRADAAPAGESSTKTGATRLQLRQSDPARRLAELRKLGGDVKLINGEWEVTGIGELEKKERADGRKRISQKTIREDLIAAAKAEREGRREGKGGTATSWFPQ